MIISPDRELKKVSLFFFEILSVRRGVLGSAVTRLAFALVFFSGGGGRFGVSGRGFVVAFLLILRKKTMGEVSITILSMSNTIINNWPII